MTSIHVLQPNVANRIAAGEVVERPLSIVKELVENALDAGATSVSVEIENGGIDLIRVSDNGKGISYEDCPTAFLRHATSKITDSEDIHHIETLGFRGEALASIASVAEVTLKTRERDAEEGTLYRIDNGSEMDYAQTACTEGTVIEVRNLFSKVPARLKFLKASRTESGYIGDYISRMILCYPNISFSFVNNGKGVYRTYGNAELKDSIYRIYGADTLTEIIPVCYDDGYIRVDGYIGSPALAKPNRTYQTIFVNGRYIKDFKLSNAVLRAYDTRLLIGKFPFFVLNLFLSPYEVDINVHPQKMEVRFADEMRVSGAVYGAVFRALNEGQGRMVEPKEIPLEGADKVCGSEEPGNILANPSDEATASSNAHRLQGFEQTNPDTVSTATHILRETYTASPAKNVLPGNFSLPGLGGEASVKSPQAGAFQLPVFDLRKKPEQLSIREESYSEERFPEAFRPVGVAFNGYLIVEEGDRIFVIDQHAAHERVLFEKLMSGEIPLSSQKLLFPQTIRVSPVEFDLFRQNEEQFSSLGYEFETDSTASEIKVKAVPVINGTQIPAGSVYEAIQLISEKGTVEKLDFVRSAIMQASCKHAVKVTEQLNEKETAALLKLYATGDIPLTCPHGRPVFITFTQRDLEKRFKRIQ